MKRNAFGQLISSPTLRFAVPQDDNAGGSGGSDGKPAGEFKAPQSQEELDKLINGAVARTHQRYTGHDDFKAKAEKWDAAEAAKAAADAASKANTPDDKQPVSESDVDERINNALAAERLELALERVNDQLDKALDGRVFPASVLFNLDRKQFVKDDGKTVDGAKLADWVKEHSTQLEQPEPKRRRIPGQGERDANAAGGSVSSGRDLYDETHKKKSGKD